MSSMRNRVLKDVFSSKRYNPNNNRPVEPTAENPETMPPLSSPPKTMPPFGSPKIIGGAGDVNYEQQKSMKSNPGQDMNPPFPPPRTPFGKGRKRMRNDMPTPPDDGGSLSSGYDLFKRKRRGILGNLASSSQKLGG